MTAKKTKKAKNLKARARKALAKAEPVDVEKLLREVDELLAELDRKSHG